MKEGFWKNKRVMVTGHTGFKGSWLSLWLQSLGANVVGYAQAPPTQPNLFELAQVGSQMDTVIGDIKDYKKLKSLVQDFQPEIVFHLAAQALVRKSYREPLETYSTNIMGTVNVLEAVRVSGKTKVVVNITSDKCYENLSLARGYREDDRMGGFDPYSSSKGCAELVTAAYIQSYFKTNHETDVALASARAGNVIGGGDWAEDRLIPDIICSIVEKKLITIRNPLAVRPWQHVLEPLSGYMLLAQKLWEQGNVYAEGWNFGPEEGDAISVEDILQRLINLWGEDIRFQIETGTNPHEAKVLKLDCSKAKKRLGWHPKWDIDTALEKVVLWTKAHLDNFDMREVCLKQIEDYQNVEVPDGTK